MKMTTIVTPTHCVLIRKDPTFAAVSGDIRVTDETAQVFALLVLI